ncbi:MFS transporter [Labrys wisconsinensis]|uniref:MFS family arabinose efflux permease n=1 Tax=Labrys wisconsinensis TaxID=425677 RepID=A0ABU0JM49_9HYPH|nr:MFS transporter [Labrys wisconsinensis]MDQ0475368.1 putative MFS family arabinose efflux permease [Labrys wisconsinensis]
MSFMNHPWRPTAAAFFVNGAIFGIWATQIPLVKQRLGLDPAVLGLALLTLGGGAVLAMAGSSWLIRRFGNVGLIRGCGAAFCVLLPVTAMAPALPLLIAVLFVFGASGGCMDVAMNAHAAQIERATGRPLMSSFHGMWSLGGLAGAAAGSLLLFVLPGPAQAGMLALLLGALLAWALPHIPVSGGERAPSGHVSLRPEAAALVIGLFMALVFEAEGTVLDWGSVYLRSELGAATEMAGAGYAAFSATMAIGRFFGDKVRQAWGAMAIMRGGSVLAAAGLAFGPLTGHPWLAVLGFALAGIGMSNIVPVLFSAAGRSRHPDAAIATASTLGYGGLLAGPPLLGFVAHATTYGTIFVVAAVMSLVIGLGASSVRWAEKR